MTSDGALGGGMDTFRHQGLTFDVRDGGPAEGEVVLLLHGFPQDATSWRHVEPLLHAAGLRTLGIGVDESPDGARIHGGELRGGRVDSHGDHRIAMAFAVAAQRSGSPVTVDDVANVATSFPGFESLARGVGFGLTTA